MKKILILTAFSLVFLSVNAQLQVTSTGRVNTLNQNVISASINNDMLDIVNSASNVSSGKDLIWTNYSLSQPYNPGLIKLSAVNTVKFVVKSNGYVGICKTTPSCALDVIGVGKINGSVILTSDERLKENIHELKDAKSSLLKLNGITFNFKSTTEQFEFLVNGEKNFFKDSIRMKVNEPDPEFYQRKHIGLLAQEVQKEFPELVFEDSVGLLSVDYFGLIPVIIEAIKAQDITLNEQNTKIENLESRVSALEALLNSSTKKSASEDIINNISDPNILSNLNLPYLLQNSPNPFNEQTEISYFLPETTTKAVIYIYNMSGTPLKSINISETGHSKIIIKGSEMKPGMYLYTLIADGKEIGTKRMILTE